MRVFRSRARSGPSRVGREPQKTGRCRGVCDLRRVQGEDRNSARRSIVSRISARFRTPGFTAPGYTMESSGTRNLPVKTFSSLGSRELFAQGMAGFYAAHDLFSCAHAVYEPVLAGRIFRVLIKGKLGIPVDRWFTPNVASHAAMEVWFHYLNAHAIARIGSWCGPSIARAQYLDPGDFEPIIDWIVENGRQGKNCCVATVISNAARIARKALQANISLRHVTFEASGEPLTQAKKRIVEDAGARIG